MIAPAFELAFADDADLPASDVADHVLVRWLTRRLGRPPSWMEVLALRAGLRERERRLARWKWWRRLRHPEPPGPDDLVADFLLSAEGQILFSFLLGNMAALLVQLALTDPWQGYDGRHPHAQPPSRQDVLRERVARGCAVPVREQARAVLAYAEWKLSGEPIIARGFIPEAVEFLAPAQAAALNAMTGTDIMGICARLRHAGSSQVGRRAVLRELDQVGGEAMRLWPGVERRVPDPPLGLWPPIRNNGDEGADAPIPGPPPDHKPPGPP